MMQKRAYLIHGWSGSPDRDFFPWLRDRLEVSGWQVIAPCLPDADHPRRESWVPFLTELLSDGDINATIVAHSMGAQAVVQSLASMVGREAIGRVILVAPAIGPLTGLTPEESEMYAAWQQAPIDYERARLAAHEFVVFCSDNDPYIPLTSAQAVAEQLHAQIIVEHGMGHYSEGEQVREVPRVLEAVVRAASE